MNHPYLYPDQAPWTEDYQELRQILRFKYGIPRDDDDAHESDTTHSL